MVQRPSAVVSWREGARADPLGANPRPDGAPSGAGLLADRGAPGGHPPAPPRARPVVVPPEAPPGAPPPGVPAPAAEALLGADATAGRELILCYQQRWRLAVTLEESCAHLGVETQRQWSALATARSTPALLGLFSLVVLLGQALHPAGTIPIQPVAWYPKQQATFSDVLATVRQHLWRQELLARPPPGAEQIILTPAGVARGMQAAAA